jgi:ABC-type uncharacterized transport system permease subunit
VVSLLVVQGANLLARWAIMRQIASLRGWLYDEVLLIYCLLMLAHSLPPEVYAGAARRGLPLRTPLMG